MIDNAIPFQLHYAVTSVMGNFVTGSKTKETDTDIDIYKTILHACQILFRGKVKSIIMIP